MKYLVIILLTVFSISVKSQSIYTPMTAGGYQMKYVKTDSGFALPFRDTTIGRGVDRPGLMVVNPQDSLPYYYSGKLWKPVYIDSSGVIELINGKIDSITVNGNNIFYWVAGLGYGQQLNKLDSIHVSSDSIFTCIAGNCTFQYLTTAGTGTVTQIIAGFGLLPDTITASGTLAVDTSVFHTSNWNNAAYAAISHTHSASDIISGTLPIVRGGTGLSGIGAVGQELRVASSGTALEYFTPNYASQTYVDSLNSVKSLSGSYYGIISGGIVTYSGTGYTYYVSACKYMIGGVVYNSRDTSITLTAADATDPRIDLFAVDTLNRVVKITGTAAATPLTPQVDPASQIALTTGITLPPSSTTPTGTSSTLIYDENTEWTTGGTATVDFNNTAQPYHGTKDAYVSAYSKNSNLTFTNGSPVTVNGQILRLFIRLNNSNYSFQVQFFNGSTAVSSIITAPVNNSLFGSYQNISIALSSFSWSSTVFNKLVVTMTGKGTAGTYYLDYVSIESGTPIVTPPTDYSNKLDSVYLRNDSLFQYVKGVETFKGKATGSGGTTTNAVTFNNSGTGDASGTTFNGSVARTVSSNTIGAVAKADSTTAYVTPTQLAAINNHINLYYPLYGINADSSVHFKNDSLPLLTYAPGVDTSGTSAMDVPVKKWVLDRIGAAGGGTVTSVAKGYGILPDGTITTTGTVSIDSASLASYFPRRKDSTVSFVTPYQSSLKLDKNDSTLANRITANTTNIASNTTAIAGKQNTLTLTTTGTSGAATLSGSTLNIPQYTGGGSSQSVTEQKEYYHGDFWWNHGLDLTTGAITSDTLYDITDYIPIEGSTSITVSLTDSTGFAVGGWTYDSSLNPISAIRSAGSIGSQLATYTFTTPSNARYLIMYTRAHIGPLHADSSISKLLRIQSTNPITYNIPITPEQFTGTSDVQRIQKAVNFARWTSSGVTLSGRYWLDSAIILSSGSTLILNNAKISMKYGMHDNMIRNEAVAQPTAHIFNRGNRKIKILGYGSAIMRGSTEAWGSSYPSGVNGQYWKANAILMANVENLDISGINFVSLNASAIVPEQCREVNISHITFDNGGGEHLNQGGIILGRGDYNFNINNIKGVTQDDIVAVQNIPNYKGDSLYVLGTTVNYMPYVKNLDVSGIVIRNIDRTYSNKLGTGGAGQQLYGSRIRVMAADSGKVHDVSIDGVSGTQEIYIQVPANTYGVQNKNNVYNLTVSNTGQAPVYIEKPISNSSFINVPNFDTSGVYQSVKLPDSSTNIYRKYYNSAPVFIDSVMGGTEYIHNSSGLTISTGLTNTGGVITNDLSTGKSGGGTIKGGSAANESITIIPNAYTVSDNGKIYFGRALTNYYDVGGGTWIFTTPSSSTFANFQLKSTSGTITDNVGMQFNGRAYIGWDGSYSATKIGGTSSKVIVANSVTPGAGRMATFDNGNMSLGSIASPNSNLQITSFAPGYVAKSTSYTATVSDYTIEVTATGQTITLPTAAGITGRQYVIKLTAAGSATVATTSSQTIDGSTTYSLSAQYKYVTVQSNGANWIIIGNN